MLIARVFTLYPEFFPGPLNKGLYGKALAEKIWKLETVNIRDYANDKHKTVDDTTYGGGSGMLIKPDVIANSLDKNLSPKEKIIYLSPKGKLFNQKLAKELSKESSINLICGHFEGIDQRLLETRNIEEISIGDFILSGGEIGAFVLIDTVVRLIPGVLGNSNSLSRTFNDFSSTNFGRFFLSFGRGTKSIGLFSKKRFTIKNLKNDLSVDDFLWIVLG